MTDKKNPDYTESAVNLRTDIGVISADNKDFHEFVIQPLANLHILEYELAKLKAEAEAHIPLELSAHIANCEVEIKAEIEALKDSINRFGSFQDVEKGEYAIKQRRETVIYKSELVRQFAPSKVASFVLIESVDSKAFEALIKAGQITTEIARQCGEIKESFAYIIK